MKKYKRILSLTLAAAMVMGMFAVSAFATDGDDNDNQDPDSGFEVNGGDDGELDPSSSQGTTTINVNPQIVGSTEKPITALPVVKTVSVDNGNASLPSETFYLQMAPTSNTTNDKGELVDADGNTIKDAEGNIVYKGPALTTPVVSYSFDASDNVKTGSVTKNDKSFSLTFEQTNTFSHAGVYRYEIYEVLPVEDDEGNITYTKATQRENYYITYDLTTYYADLYVDADKDGNYVVINTVVRKGDETKKPTQICFDNEIDVANIIIKKVVDGTEYTKDQLFDFYILIPVGGDTITLSAGEKIQAQICNATGVVNDDRSNADGVVELEVKGAGITADVMTDGTKVQLKNGEYLEIFAPVSMIYKVCEADYTGQGYETTAKYTEKGTFAKSTTLSNNDKTYVAKATDADAAKGLYEDYKVFEAGTYADEDGVVCVRGTTNNLSNIVLFTNERNVTVSTGINVDVIPYILVMIVAVCGGVLFISKKRRIAR